MIQLTTKQKIVMVTAFTFSPFFGTLIVMLVFSALPLGTLNFSVFRFIEILNISLQYSIFGLTLYFLPATLIGLIFNKQILNLKVSRFIKVLNITLIGFFISAVWALLFGYFYVGNISERLQDYIQLVLSLGTFGAVISTVVAALIFKFMLK